MHVQSIHLINFRNYTTLDAFFSPRQNIFLGKNGQGKTNLLEALYFLSHARSHRTNGDRELIRSGASFAAISAHLVNHQYHGHTQLDAQIKGEGERLKTVFKANSNLLRSRSEVLGYLPTVSFFLPDLLLLRGAPEDRRRWLDAAIVQYDKRHLKYLSEFQKVRQQKNRLLKAIPEQISRDHLRVWNAQFAATGAKVVVSRLTYLAMIEDLAAVTYLELSSGQEKLRLAYQSAVLEYFRQNVSSSPELLPDTSELEEVMEKQLETIMPEEIRRATSLLGPHRDDINFYLDDLPADAYGSQGQQRSIVLALKLTELKCLNRQLHEPPILLLDDVMAELDPDRQRLLVEHIHPESQVFITTTHPSSSWQTLLEHQPGNTSNAGMQVFQVHQGTFMQPDSHFQSPLLEITP